MIEFWTQTQAPYEQTLFELRGGSLDPARLSRSPNSTHYDSEIFQPVKALLDDQFLTADSDCLAHSYFQREVPRTMLIEDVEAIWAPIAATDNWHLFDQALKEISEMQDAYAKPR